MKETLLSYCESQYFSSGIQAVVSILGIAWLGDTCIHAHQSKIIELAQYQITKHPWQFGLMRFIMSIIIFSR